jgi:hypothetical protein
VICENNGVRQLPVWAAGMGGDSAKLIKKQQPRVAMSCAELCC